MDPRQGRRRRQCSCGSPRCWGHGGRRTPCGTRAGSRPSSTPRKASSTWSATTSRSSSSRTGSSSPTSSTPQAAPRPGDPAGAERPRHVLGLRLAAHRGDPPRHVEHVRPGDAALLPDDGGLRRPHLPAGQRRRARPRWSSSTGSRGCGVHSLVVGGGADRSAASTRTSTAATWPTRIEAGRLSRVGAGHPDLRRRRDQTFEGIDLLDPTKIVPEELAPVQPVGLLTLNAQPAQLLRRDRAGRLPRRPPGARNRRHRRPAAGGAAVLLPGHPAHPTGRAQLRPDPDQPAARAGQRHAARRHAPDGRAHRGSRPTGRTARRRLPVPARPTVTWRCRSRCECRAARDDSAPRVVRGPLQPAPAVLAQPERRSRRSTSSPPTPSN